MNQRLFWNFEIKQESSLDWPALPSEEKDALKWEARFFWPENEIIVLHGLDEQFMDLTRYEIKRREDCYILLEDFDYNIKKRKGNLLYKPQLHMEHQIRGFAKKINLEHSAPETALPGCTVESISSLLDKLQKGEEITVHKIALIYPFQTQPSVKLELARLHVHGKIYFTVCVEGRSFNLVRQITQHLLPGKKTVDYVNFLKRQLHHD
nr:hypothetical protein [Legionella jordanis]